MHSADVSEHYIYIFRGGDGKDYLNDLHRLNTLDMNWQLVQPEGEVPPLRGKLSYLK
jgi:hypothetical protein